MKNPRRQTLTLISLLTLVTITVGLAITAIILLPTDLTNIALGILGLSLIGAGATGLLGLWAWEIAAHLIGDAAIVCLLGYWAWQGVRSLRAWLRWRRVRSARLAMLHARNVAEGRYRG